MLPQQIRRVLRRPEVLALTRELGKRGASGWIVGGAARDLVLGLEVPDVDAVVDADPFDVARALESAGAGTFVPLSESMPRVARVAGRGELDIALLEGSRIEEDLARRDFTANAFALALPGTRRLSSKPKRSRPSAERAEAPEPEWIDPFGGLRDLAARRLRMISEENLRDDPLRTWRAARLYATRGLRPDAATTAACRRTAGALSSAAPERIRAELEKLLAARHAAPALGWAAEAGLLGEALGIPLDRSRARRVVRDGFDAPALARRAPDERALLRLALLASRCGLEPQDASSWLLGRRFSRAISHRVARLLALAGRAASGRASEERWTWVRDAGEDAVLALALARRLSRRAADVSAIASHERAARSARRPPRVTGDDVVAWLGEKPGPETGAWLRRIEIAGLRGAIRTRAGARRWLLAQVSGGAPADKPTERGAAGL